MIQAILALGQSAVDIDQPHKMLAQAIAQWDIQRIPKGTEIQGIFQ